MRRQVHIAERSRVVNLRMSAVAAYVVQNRRDPLDLPGIPLSDIVLGEVLLKIVKNLVVIILGHVVVLSVLFLTRHFLFELDEQFVGGVGVVRVVLFVFFGVVVGVGFSLDRLRNIATLGIEVKLDDLVLAFG